MKNDLIRSPFFYVGDKYKLMPQLKKFFPRNISIYAEPFVGGGSSFLNTEAKRYFLNDNFDGKLLTDSLIAEIVKNIIGAETGAGNLLRFLRHRTFMPMCSSM